MSIAQARLRRGWSGAVLGIMGASAVALGAFGAHALRDALTPSSLEIWRTAVQYHFWHTLAFALAAMMPSRSARFAAAFFAIGVVLFCGSLYALALGAPRLAGAITPFGGVAFIAGWIALGASLVLGKARSTSAVFCSSFRGQPRFHRGWNPDCVCRIANANAAGGPKGERQGWRG